MSDETHIGISSSKIKTLLEALGFAKQSSIPIALLQPILKISGVMSAHGIDEETTVALLKSYESRFGTLDDPHLRVSKFHDFVASIHAAGHGRNAFIDQVKNLGLLSKSELEEHAKETGDWSHFLKRVEHDNQPNVARPEAAV